MGSGDWLREYEIGYGKWRLVMGSGDCLCEVEIGMFKCKGNSDYFPIQH
jgi:hypothetical protein